MFFEIHHIRFEEKYRIFVRHCHVAAYNFCLLNVYLVHATCESSELLYTKENIKTCGF